MFSDHFFFFKQKTAYDMRISDWSSDVCSSDLLTQPNPFETVKVVKKVAKKLPKPKVKKHSAKNIESAATAAEEATMADESENDDGFIETEKEDEIERASCRERVCQ